MRILILGGTQFLGRALVEDLLRRGHEVTLFNRGQTNPELFPEVERLRGDRGSDLAALKGKRWDAAIDTSGYLPAAVRLSAETLADAVDRYVFISTMSVYADVSRPGVDESGILADLQPGQVEELSGETYGALKARSEQAAQHAIPGRVLVIRPGLIVGPHDPTDRFTYWPHRVALGGEVLAPGRPERLIQFIDVRDLAEWTNHMVETGQTGIYNATGPATPMTMESFLNTCKSVSRSNAAFTWVPEDFLLDQNVEPWMEMPLWIPESEPSMAGFFGMDVSKAIAMGLRFRPVADTVRATLDWDALRDPDQEWRAGLSADREAELLRAWHAHQGE